MIRFNSSAATNAGGRAYNEDSMLDRPDLGLWAVADGAGGHAFGAVASAAVVAALDTIPPGLAAAEILAQVRLRLGSVHAALLTAAAAEGDGCVMGSTVVILIARETYFACLWAGDSRVYRLREGALDQLSRDHSLVQELVDDGRLTEPEADAHPQRNVITRAIGGGGEAPQLDKMTGRIRAGDRFLLCSDGVCKTLPAAELAVLLTAGVPAGPLVAAVLDRSPGDNVTAVVVDAI